MFHHQVKIPSQTGKSIPSSIAFVPSSMAHLTAFAIHPLRT
jgi:hypothetical protein